MGTWDLHQKGGREIKVGLFVIVVCRSVRPCPKKLKRERVGEVNTTQKAERSYELEFKDETWTGTRGQGNKEPTRKAKR